MDNKEKEISQNNLNVGLKLAKARTKKGYSQRSVAEKLGLTRLTISKYEHNESQPSFQTLQTMCHLYEIPIWELFSTPDDLATVTNKYLDDELKNALLDQIIDSLVYEGVLSEKRITDDMKKRLKATVSRKIKKLQKEKPIDTI